MTPLSRANVQPEPGTAERLAQFARTRDQRVLWPGLAEAALITARHHVESAVRAVLAGRPAALDAQGEHGVYAIQIAAYTSGTGALLGRWAEDGRLQLADALRPMFARQLDQGRRRAARIEREVMPALDALLARGITPAAHKGFHVARAYCEEPGARPAADVDLFVPPDRLDDARAALRAAGFEPTGAGMLHPHKSSWKGARVDSRVFSIEGISEHSLWEIDLHTSFDRRSFAGNVHLDHGRSHLAPFTVAGRALLAPAQPLLIMVLACQLSADPDSMRLMRLVDLVRVIRSDHDSGRLDWDAVLDFMRRSGSARMSHAAFTLADDLAPGTVDPRVRAAAFNASSRATRHVVARLRPGGAALSRTGLVQHFMYASGPKDIASEVVRMLLGDAPRKPAAVMKRFIAHVRRALGGTFPLQHLDESGRDSGVPARDDRD